MKDCEVLHPCRRAQILRLLLENGPLSLTTMRHLLTPPITQRRLQDATKRLADQGLIVRRFDTLPNNAGHFYQLSSRQVHRPKIAGILGRRPEDLQDGNYRSRELHHSESCALWAHYFGRVLPMAEIVREQDYLRSPIAAQALLSSLGDFELRPDLLLHIRLAHRDCSLTVGVEIERTRKSNRRLLTKLDGLSNKTRLDGVIYICARDTITEALRTIYLSQVMQRAHRIRHYGANFILLCDAQVPSPLEEPRMFNAQLRAVSLTRWTRFLIDTEPDQRRDSQLDPPA